MDDLSRRAVIEELELFEKRTREIIGRIDGKRSIGAFERDELQAMYSALKEDVKAAAKLGKATQDRDAQTDWERYYFAPAMLKAANGLRAKTNSHPINSNWIGSLLDAACEFSYYLAMLQKDRPGDR